jgi:hypothetical protein
MGFDLGSIRFFSFPINIVRFPHIGHFGQNVNNRSRICMRLAVNLHEMDYYKVILSLIRENSIGGDRKIHA